MKESKRYMLLFMLTILLLGIDIGLRLSPDNNNNTATTTTTTTGDNDVLVADVTSPETSYLKKKTKEWEHHEIATPLGTTKLQHVNNNKSLWESFGKSLSNHSRNKKDGNNKVIDGKRVVKTFSYPFLPVDVIRSCGGGGGGITNNNNHTLDGTTITVLSNNEFPHLNYSLAFVKTHKTGGSTVAGVVNRITDGRNLQKMSPYDNTYLGWPRREFPGQVRGLDFRNDGRYYNVIDNHVILNREAFERYLRPTPLFCFSIIREPISQAISSFNFFPDGKTWPEFIDSLKQVNKTLGWKNAVSLNPAALSFGWYADHNYSTAYDHDNDRIEAFIQRIDQELDFVMIMEEMESCLALLRTNFLPALQIYELAYYKHKQHSTTKKAHVLPTEEEEKELEQVLHVDRMIYNHFSNKLHKLIQESEENSNGLLSKQTNVLKCLNKFVQNNIGSSRAKFPRVALFKLDSGGYTDRLFRKQMVAWPEVGEGFETDPKEKKREEMFKRVRARKNATKQQEQGSGKH